MVFNLQRLTFKGTFESFLAKDSGNTGKLELSNSGPEFRLAIAKVKPR